MPKHKTEQWADAARHPIAWFSALLRGIDRSDVPLTARALTELEALGFKVRIVKPKPDGKGVTQ